MSKDCVSSQLDAKGCKFMSLDSFMMVITLIDHYIIVPFINQHYIVPHPSSVKTTTITTKSESSSLLKSSLDSLNDVSISLNDLIYQSSINQSTSQSSSTLTVVTADLNDNDPTKDARHVEAVYSMWSHFLDFCSSDENSVVKESRLVATPDPFNPINVHTGKTRLAIFMKLSQGKSV